MNQLPKTTRTFTASDVFLSALGLTLTAGLIATLWFGRAYYALDRLARVDHPLHDVLAPGAGGGILLGIVGTSLMTLMLLYTLRKRLMHVRWLGRLATWLRFHILCGIFGPLYIVLHSGLQLPAGIIAVGFWCMAAVAASGVFGRYVYGLFPRLSSGRELAWGEAEAELTTLRAELVAETAGATGDHVGQAVQQVRDFTLQARTVPDLIRLDREVRRRRARIRELLEQAGLPAATVVQARGTLDAQLQLKRGLESTRAAHRLFRYWHLFHRPLASAMYVIVTLHVLLAVLFGGSLGRVATLFAELP